MFSHDQKKLSTQEKKKIDSIKNPPGKFQDS